MRSSRVSILVGGLAGTSILLGIVAGPAHASGEPSGSAFGISVEATLVNSIRADVKPQPVARYPKGETRSVVTLDTNIIKARLLSASAHMRGNTLTSEASIADIRGLDGLLSAKLITATCRSGPSGTHGSSALVEASLGGTRLTVASTGDIDIGAGVVSVRVNEQIRQGGSLTVNALHITVGGGLREIAELDIILGQAKCFGATAGGTTPPVATSSPTGTSSTTDHPSVTPTSGLALVSKNTLADTGVSGVLPLAGSAALLLAVGGGLYWATRRRRSTGDG